LRTLNTGLEQQVAKIPALESKFREAERLAQVASDKVTGLKSDGEKLKDSHATVVENLQKKFECEVKKNDRHAAELAQVKETHATSVEELRTKLEGEVGKVEQHVTVFGQLKDQVQRSSEHLDAKTQELESVKEKLESAQASKDEANDQMEKLKQELETVIGLVPAQEPSSTPDLPARGPKHLSIILRLTLFAVILSSFFVKSKSPLSLNDVLQAFEPIDFSGTTNPPSHRNSTINDPCLYGDPLTSCVYVEYEPPPPEVERPSSTWPLLITTRNIRKMFTSEMHLISPLYSSATDLTNLLRELLEGINYALTTQQWDDWTAGGEDRRKAF
jgi:hypothetical protein